MQKNVRKNLRCSKKSILSSWFVGYTLTNCARLILNISSLCLIQARQTFQHRNAYQKRCTEALVFSIFSAFRKKKSNQNCFFVFSFFFNKFYTFQLFVPKTQANKQFMVDGSVRSFIVEINRFCFLSLIHNLVTIGTASEAS